ncbi:hypothetical protein Vafri_4728 [Volvox africanus]|uniref:Peptidase M11 gametolysin domain-containing protein n=2 Tax=Volvox africanus TaxID=51714 RepID=A0A8J4AVV2_9CHLO|nr:hypothetical protein Vafri_4728 [Volvox africanus]
MDCRFSSVLVLGLILLLLDELVITCPSAATARTAAALGKGIAAHPHLGRKLRQLQGAPFEPEAPEGPSSPEEDSIIEGELQVYINEAGPPSFLVFLRNGSIVPVSLREAEAAETLQYAGQTVRLHVAANSTALLPSERMRPGEQSILKSSKQTTSDGTPSEEDLMAQGFLCNDCVMSMDLSAAPTAIKSSNDNEAQQVISTVIFLISFCGYGPAIDVASFRSMWLNGPDTPPNTRTMQNTWDFCSQGKVVMENSTQRIFDIPLQCAGIMPGTRNPYSFKSGWEACYTSSLNNMMALAEHYVQNTLGEDISGIKQRIAVIPAELNGYCNFGGLAGLGCTGSRCYSWINGLFANNLYLYLHEMGHNMGLYHSRIPGRDYGDDTCTMGNARTCFNAPNMWRLGWVSPLPGGDLNGTTLPVGRVMTFFLPGQNENPKSYLRINPTWAITGREISSTTKAPVPAFFISHRYKEVPFDNLSPANSHIAVHTYNGTRDPQSYQNVTLEASILVKGVYRAPMPFGLVVRFLSYKSGGNATITLCRAGREIENQGGSSCFDGLDNDCDGLVDLADPDCAGVPRPQPQPPSPRPPPSPGRSPPPSPPRPSPSPPSHPIPPPSPPSHPISPPSPPSHPISPPPSHPISPPSHPISPPSHPISPPSHPISPPSPPSHPISPPSLPSHPISPPSPPSPPLLPLPPPLQPSPPASPMHPQVPSPPPRPSPRPFPSPHPSSPRLFPSPRMSSPRPFLSPRTSSPRPPPSPRPASRPPPSPRP